MPNHRAPQVEAALQERRPAIAPNTPHYTLAAAVVLVVVGVAAAYVTDNRQSMTTLLGLIATTVPSLLAAGYAERASRDIRNGTVTEKARQGSVRAMEEVGVVDVVEASNRGQGTLLAMQALAALLEERGVKPDQVAQDPDDGEQLRP